VAVFHVHIAASDQLYTPERDFETGDAEIDRFGEAWFWFEV
jgi:hypothetical protein